MSEVNLFEVEVTKDAGDPDGYHASYARIAPLVGGRLLGLSVYELPPGQSICPYHYEIGYEEWLLVLTGYGGQVSLGHGAYAGLGALAFARLSGSISELPALLVGMAVAGLVGLLTGYPAIRRRGLFLAGEFEALSKCDVCNGESSFGIFFHVADGIVNVFVEHELFFARDGEKRQHVTTRKRCHKGLLGIDQVRVAQISGCG